MYYYVYVLTNQKNKTLYVGVTNDLVKRVYEHKQKFVDDFTKKYCVDKLVYYETTNDVISAIEREKQIKKWNRAWKIRLIKKVNPDWADLYDSL